MQSIRTTVRWLVHDVAPAAALLPLLYLPSAAAQASPDRAQTMTGVRAVAMGGAFAAVADDATAIAWNPAGLASVRVAELSWVGNMRLIQTDPRFDATNFAYASVRANTASAPVNFASVAIPFRLLRVPFTVGVAYRALHDLGRSEELKSYYENGSAQASLLEINARRGGIWALSPSVAVAPFRWLQLGATYSSLLGSTELERIVTVEGAVPSPGTQRSTSRVSGYEGTPLDFGVLLRLPKGLSIGARQSSAYDRISETEGSPRTRIAVPASRSIGLAWRPMLGRVWAFDLREEPWSEGEVFNDETGAYTGPAGQRDLTSLHFGYERVDDYGARRVATRVGVFTKPTAYNDANDDPIDGIGFSLGRGWHGLRLRFDTAITYVRYSEHVRTQSEFGTYSVVDQEIQLTAGVTWRFP